jgi:hypothetical protein
MNILHTSQTLFYLIEQQADSANAVNYLQQQATAFNRVERQTALFYRVFTALPRFVGKGPVVVAPDMVFAIERARPGWSVSGWSRDRLARVWWLLQLPADDETYYVPTISELFRAAELNELVALYSALPVLAWPERWQFLATEGVRNNIADVQSALMLNNPYPADYLDEAAWNQLILKAFFTDKDVSQIVGLTQRNNPALRQTLLDYVAERRAAGRDIPDGISALTN